jgi:hypothetical protein
VKSKAGLGVGHAWHAPVLLPGPYVALAPPHAPQLAPPKPAAHTLQLALLVLPSCGVL